MKVSVERQMTIQVVILSICDRKGRSLLSSCSLPNPWVVLSMQSCQRISYKPTGVLPPKKVNLSPVLKLRSHSCNARSGCARLDVERYRTGTNKMTNNKLRARKK